MLRSVRILLMWLLALAVPLQGFGAVAMAACGPGHQGHAAGELHAGPHAGGAELGGRDGHADHAHTHAVHAGSATPHTHDGPAGDSTAGKTTCSACASCCTAAALPVTVFAFEPTPLVLGYDVPESRGAVVFVTDGPDRPPRVSAA